jgi:hypothetical protein
MAVIAFSMKTKVKRRSNLNKHQGSHHVVLIKMVLRAKNRKKKKPFWLTPPPLPRVTEQHPGSPLVATNLAEPALAIIPSH